VGVPDRLRDEDVRPAPAGTRAGRLTNAEVATMASKKIPLEARSVEEILAELEPAELYKRLRDLARDFAAATATGFDPDHPVQAAVPAVARVLNALFTAALNRQHKTVRALDRVASDFLAEADPHWRGVRGVPEPWKVRGTVDMRPTVDDDELVHRAIALARQELKGGAPPAAAVAACVDLIDATGLRALQRALGREEARELAVRLLPEAPDAYDVARAACEACDLSASATKRAIKTEQKARQRAHKKVAARRRGSPA